MLAGERAVAFADARGIETDRDLLTDETRERFQAADPPDGGVDEHVAWVRKRFGGELSERGDHDTVGAVATDGESVAAATSTAGVIVMAPGDAGEAHSSPAMQTARDS